MAESHIVGCILGTAVGDALGLPYEGVSPARGPRLLGPPDRYRFCFGRGMVSDDTEHTCLVAQALIATGDDLDRFTRDFARRLRWWLLGLPAGIGRATLRATLKLWCGASPRSSGVFSAGNGPSMRAAVFGAAFDDVGQMVDYVRASTRITHSDPKAEFGAIAVALAAHLARHDAEVDPPAYIEQLSKIVGPAGEELTELLRHAAESAARDESTGRFAAGLGLERGVTGYTYHTLPVVIHAWFAHPRDYRGAVTAVIECGGDADTTAAIVGGIVGTATGEAGIPREWLDSIGEWPRSVGWMRRLGQQLARCRAESRGDAPLRLNPLALLARNLFFLAVVLVHALRRLLPPY